MIPEEAWNGAIEYDAVMIVRRALQIGAQEKLSLQSALEKVGDFTGAAGTYEYDATTKDWLTPMSIAHIVGGKLEYHK
jgi:ABC-type branched-subunit amino acid transport system substrate-binding protein